MNSTRHLARRLGGEAVGHDQVLMPGPGHSGDDRSLHVTFHPDGSFRVHSYSGDDWRTCREHVAGLLGEAAWEPAAGGPNDPEERRQRAMAWWREGIDPDGTATRRYLRSRGLSLATREIRHHRRLYRKDSAPMPAMLALMRDVLTGEPRAIHRTWLDEQDRKVERKMYGPARGTAIMLDRRASSELTVGEGVESTMSAPLLGFENTQLWAMGSAGAIAALPVVPGIRLLRILGENGDDGVNLRAARECADRWRQAGVEVVYLRPDVDCNDANDQLMKRMRTDA